MSENWRVQISPKLPDGTLINIRAEEIAELEGLLSWFHTNAAKIVATTHALQDAAKVPGLAQNVQSVQVGYDQSPRTVAEQVQQATQIAQDTVPQAQGPAPVCQHGPRSFREGTSSKGPWKAWFCQSKNRNDQCKAQWL